jgi:hypothetical protein
MTLIKDCWIYTLIAFSTFTLCKSLTFEIERFLTKSKKYDVIPNNIGISAQGQWIELKQCQSKCNTKLNGQCLSRNNCCKCSCSYGSSTFRMGATAANSTCIKNRILRSSAGQYSALRFNYFYF